jgi:hypothetical protein
MEFGHSQRANSINSRLVNRGILGRRNRKSGRSNPDKGGKIMIDMEIQIKTSWGWITNCSEKESAQLRKTLINGEEWRNIIIGTPHTTEKYSVEELIAFGMVGLYGEKEGGDIKPIKRPDRNDMAVQVRLDVDLTPLIRGGQSAVEQNAILLTDAGRSVPLVFGTLLSKVAASGKYVPFTDEAAVDGSALPSGVYIGPDIPAADIVAGDVPELPIYLGVPKV